MSREKVVGSYLVRFVEKNHQPQYSLHNLKTGERLEFESWVAVWFYLDQLLVAGREAEHEQLGSPKP